MLNSLGPDRSVCQGEAVTLTQNSGDITQWQWNNGSSQSYININTAGDYSVTVSNARGCRSLDTAHFGLSGIAPTVLFSADTACFGDSTAFTNLTSLSGGGTIQSYGWDFGDGTTSALYEPKHRYSQPDTFVATLTVAADGGCGSFHEDSVVVRYRPEAGFEAEFGQTHCTGSPVRFTDTTISEMALTGYFWDFGDSGTSSQQDPSHQYLTSGAYTVGFTATAQNGCSDTAGTQLSIVDTYYPPGAAALASPPDGYFMARSQPVPFIWQAGEHSVSYIFEISADSTFATLLERSAKQDTLGYRYTVSGEGGYYWRIITYNLCGDSTTSAYRAITYRAIDRLPGINLWLSASDGVVTDGSGNVQYWKNQVNTSDSSFQGDDTKRPMLLASDSLINGEPAVYFDGYNDFLYNATGYSFGAMYVVSRWGGAEAAFPGYNGAVSTYGSGNATIYVFIGNKYTSSVYPGATPWGAPGIFVNGQGTLEYSPLDRYKILYGQTATPAGYTGLLFGSAFTNDHFWKGPIAEVIAFDTIPSDSVKAVINGYLQNKYSPPADLGADISVESFAGTAISAHRPWFTSYNWSTGPTDSAITVSQSGTYSVTATDIFGFTSSDSVVVTYPQPINITDTVICQYDTVTWNLGIKGNYSYLWSTGGTASELNITETGDYWLVIQDTLGNPWYSDTVTVVVNDFPSRISLGNDTTLCKGNRLYLQNGMEAVVDYLWNDGSANDFITINEAGTYSVMVSDNMGCVGYDTVVLDVKGIAPNPDFTALNFCLNDTVQFLDASTSPDGSEIIQWDWNFGDGNTSAGNETTHQYLEPGSYPVTLQIQSASLCTNSIQKQVDVFHLPEPAFLPLTACSNAAVPFYDKSMSRDGVVTSWNWLFPDGSGSILQNPEFTFASTGTKQIQLVVTTNLGCKDTLWKSIEIKQGPATGFSYSAACVGYPVYFTDQTVSFMNLPLVYEWTINGEPFSFESSPMYQFNSSGTVDVKLQTSQSTNGCSSSKSEQIVVHKNPEVGFDIPMICAKNPNTFEGIIYDSEGEIHLWKWLLNQQPAFDTKDIEFRYDTAGIYHAVLMVEDVYGCRDTSQNPFEVFDIPVPLFTASVEKGPVPLEIQFTNHSQGADTYYWQFGDGGSSTDIEPQHTYIDSGQFQIQLTAYSPIGCADSVFSLVKGIIPMVDVAAAEIQTEQSNGFLKVRVLIQNLGTIDLDEMVVSYKTNNSQEFREVINQTFPSGKSLWYEFKTQVALDENQPLTHVCVALSLKTTADEYLSNNETCKAFENAFKTLNPYPNPASEKLVVEFIIPFDAQVSIQLFDGFGKKNELLFEGTTQAGFCRKVFDISGLEAGIYFYKITYEGNTHAYQFMVK